MKKLPYGIFLTASVLLSAGIAANASATARLTDAQIAALVTDGFGPDAKADVSSGTTMPRYIWASLDGLKSAVLVVPISVDRAKGSLNARSLKVISFGEDDIRPDDAVGAHCLGLAFFHGLSGAKWGAKPSDVYFLYECFSGYTRVARGAALLRNAHVRAAGDAVLLDLETGGQLLVYWKRGRYRAKQVRMGD